MTPTRFQQLRNLFDAALEREPSERASYLDAACQGDTTLRHEVDRLLEAHDSETHLLEESALPPAWNRIDPLSREGSRVGPYEILRELGSGGMGTVYLARRADEAFQRLVAVKVLRADVANDDLIRRFQREREILASLDHPNVTRLLDAGTTADSLPYFVMEYVEGTPIHIYCDQEQLPVEERLRLFQQVCDAAAYAHRHGVIHRDLKPGNILVSNGQVKVLDFGIARVFHGQLAEDTLTAASLLMMTPQYASPEQVRGEPATRQSDVYALGVILYELVTGHSPYRLRSRVYHEIIRVVCEEAPTRPSVVIATPIDGDGDPIERKTTVAPETASRMRRASLDEWKEQLRGDLDAVLLKALSKQPMDRYNSPDQLRDDLERHLRREPVWAREVSWWQKSAAAISRHRALVIGTVAVLAAVISGAVKLELSAVFYAAGAGLLFFLWYAATDREFGRKIGGSFLTGRVLMAILMALAFVPLNDLGNLTILNGVLAVVPLIGLGYVLAWLFRERWTGPLVVEFSHPNFWWTLYVGLVVLEFSIGLLKGKVHAEGWLGFVAERAGRATLAIVLFLTGRREIRQAGILLGGHLIRWSSIRSWAWEPDSGPPMMDPREPPYPRKEGLISLQSWGWDPNASIKKDDYIVLRFDLHRRVHFLPPARIRVEWHEQFILGPILSRHLGDWPN